LWREIAATNCPNAALSVYVNAGNPFNCTENAGMVSVFFNHDVLPSYTAISLLAANNSAVLPSNINVVPGTPALSFQGNFNATSSVLASQAELVHFLMTTSGQPFGSTLFSMLSATTGTGGLGAGTGLAIGQELVCVGGSFTSLPTGLYTTVASGLLPVGQYGCNGVALVGTAAVSSGPLSAITSTLALPDLTGLTDTAQILFSPTSTTVDVIKMQALLTVGGGVASTAGFGDSFSAAPTPEPATALTCFLALAVLGGRWRFQNKRKHSN
jgi:hypothetical protein